ncbi:hypothetical protein [Niabella soli]|uniref:Uncharacterized protein n=1 Tax=Niabella soli DSM 19437 TaxID=929713 RepID=W0F4N9_9BACT|nr:hypothetical protein [Niabella soli]AHF17977.1 hypothetical protein NIASO_18015 [Niabella soli DSM 19437]
MNNERVIAMDEHGCYSLTLETADLIDIFIRPVYKQIAVHSLNYYINSKGLIVYGWCLMPNKLYMICKTQKNSSFGELRESFKEFTTEKVMEAVGDEPLERQEWLIEHFRKNTGLFKTFKKLAIWKQVKEMQVLDLNRPESIAEHLSLIHTIPVQQRIVRYPADFIYSSAFDYETGTEGLVKITRLPVVEAALDDIENRKSVFKTKFNRR